MEPTELAVTLAPLTDVLAGLGETVAALADSQAQAERRQTLRARILLGGLAVLIAIAGSLGYISLTNRTVLAKINAVTGPKAVIAQQATSRSILLSNAVETDCRSRRQQARLPAPDTPPPPPASLPPSQLGAYFARYSCAAVTPPDVYPGVAGQPPRSSP